MGDLRAKALASVLAKHIPGNPTITFQYMPGGGGRKAANHLYTNARIEHDLVKEKLADFHATIEIPRGRKDSRFAHLNLPDIETFARSEREKKLLSMMRAFRSIGTALLLPPGTPKDRVDILKEAVRRSHTDPALIAEYRKLTGGDGPTPLMPDEQAKVVKEIPAMLKR